MLANKEVLSPTRVKLSIEIPFTELEPSIKSAYQKISNQVTIPGFRKGKVPTSIIDQRVGRGQVLEEAVNDALPKFYAQAIKEHDLRPVGSPQVDITELADGTKFSFTAEVDIRPEFDLPDASSIAIVVDDVTVDDQMVKDQLDLLRKRFATLLVVERPAKESDVVILDAKGTVAGEESDDYTATALTYELGTNGLVEGADAALIGIAADETREISFVPTDGPHKDVQVVVKFSCTGVRERQLPEADDKFAQMASEFDTLAELEADLKERLRRMKIAEQAIGAREKVFESLLEMVEIDLPENLIASEIASHFADGHGDDAHKSEFERDTRKNLKSQFILDKIADDANVQVNESELSEWLLRSAPRYGVTPEQLAEQLVKDDALGVALNEVRRGKALSVAVARAKVSTKDGSLVDLSEFIGVAN